MTYDEAKKIAEAISNAAKEIARSAYSFNEAMSRCVERMNKMCLTTDPAAPVEKEYRAGEWVPKKGNFYYYITAAGTVCHELWDDGAIDLYRLSQGNVYPTEAIAEAAKKHAEFWRAFDMAGEGGEWGLLMESGKLECVEVIGPDGTPRFQTEENGLAAIERLGGEAYVSEMLTKGRVFRFKWGVE